jgi:ParB-like chromosome segregation protein Spo0J
LLHYHLHKTYQKDDVEIPSYKVDQILSSINKNGYKKDSTMIVKEVGDMYVVLDGKLRLVALKRTVAPENIHCFVYVYIYYSKKK